MVLIRLLREVPGNDNQIFVTLFVHRCLGYDLSESNILRTVIANFTYLRHSVMILQDP